MSKIFEALQYAETERIQLEKMARRLPAQSAADMQALIPESIHEFIPTRADRTSCNCEQSSYRIRRQRFRDSLLRVVGLYPWQCSKCHRRFHRLRRF